jgi:putative aminopeptidase FrvX
LRDDERGSAPAVKDLIARYSRALVGCSSAFALVSGIAMAQAPADPPAATAAVASWLGFDAPPGEESRITDAITASDSHWRRDQLGNLIMVVGSGHPRRLVACGLDHVGFIVSEITDDGYIRLHRAGSTGSAAAHPLWDQFHQAQQVRVLTRTGSVPGVVAVDNVHFAQQHRGDTAVVNVDQLWVDVGARTRQDVERMGVSLIDPVVRDLPQWLYADNVAGADAGGRAGCAAVASVAHAAAAGAHAPGETVFVLSVQSSFSWRGLGAAAARLGKFDQATVVTGAALGSTDAAPVSRSGFAPRARGTPVIATDSITRLAVRTRFPGTLVESVRAADLDSLLVAVRLAAGARAEAATSWLQLRQSSATRPAHVRDSLSTATDILTRLAELPGVADREAPVREAIRSALPDWARKIAVQDSAGNLIVAMGPERDTAVFLAHMDEVGYTVRSIHADGSVALTPQGGLNGAAWDGQPAVLYIDTPSSRGGASGSAAPARLQGVFIPREQARLRRPDSVSAWFGMDSAALAARGVRTGMAVTAYKRGERLGATRFTARALDDRAGDTALLLAIARIDPARLNHKVIFVWSMEEELGLFGADALARAIGTSVHHAYAIDTFVSSDTPLESPLFAFAPLGDGPVLRASDDGMIMLATERERIVALARTAGLPLQVGTTKGSTDAVPFVARGAIGAQLGWPGRYSHSPAEVLDLKDLTSLARMVELLAR